MRGRERAYKRSYASYLCRRFRNAACGLSAGITWFINRTFREAPRQRWNIGERRVWEKVMRLHFKESAFCRWLQLEHVACLYRRHTVRILFARLYIMLLSPTTAHTADWLMGWHRRWRVTKQNMNKIGSKSVHYSYALPLAEIFAINHRKLWRAPFRAIQLRRYTL